MKEENKSLVLGNSMGGYLSSTNVKNFLQTMLNERTGSFIASMTSITNMDGKLLDCTAKSLMMCGLKAASLNLPIDPNLGYAYPVPYKNNGIKEAQFQMGYKGYIQLAMRSGQYKKINVTDIKVGEEKRIDYISEEYEFVIIPDSEKRESQPIAGYYAKFVLLNGFEKALYWSLDKLLSHAKRYSKTFNFNDSSWKKNQDDMCRKTMLRQLLTKWGPMSVEMQEAYKADMAVINYNEETGQEEIIYPDNDSKSTQNNNENVDKENVEDSPFNNDKSEEYPEVLGGDEVIE